MLEELRLAEAPAAGSPPPTDVEAQEEEDGDDSLLRHLGFDPVGLDALSARAGFGAAALQAQLLELELDGRVARLPGGLFQRVGVA